MNIHRQWRTLFVAFFLSPALTPRAIFQASPGDPKSPPQDPRNVETGNVIPSLNYADQPYLAVTPRGEWVCVLTTGTGREGSRGQHVASTTSTDRGRTWEPLVAIEPPDGPEASWACPLATPFGRVYAFYTYNGDRVHLGRDDTHGWYACKWSDDGGRSWSRRRLRLPVRRTRCDRLYKDGKLVQMFWGVSKPIVVDGTVYFAFTKLGRYFLEEGEGWVFRSSNVLEERDPERVRWEMLPYGDTGIRHPEFGSVQEEHNLAPLGRPHELVCVFRTTNGWPAVSYSRDGARTWTLPEPLRYRPGGRVIRHPRACAKIWRTRNGKYLLWCHQNGGRSFEHRNPVWIMGGIETLSGLRWSEPEILLYHDDPKRRLSYPDLIEEDGRYWITETDKETARIHEIDRSLLEGLWGQFEAHQETAREGLLLELEGPRLRDAIEGGVHVGKLADLARRGGFAVEVEFRLRSLAGPRTLLLCEAAGRLPGKENPGEEGSAERTKEKAPLRGFRLGLSARGTLELAFGDGTHSAAWDADKGRITAERRHHAVFIADGGPAVVSVVADGVFCDGGTEPRLFGWGRFDRRIGAVPGGLLRFEEREGVEWFLVRIYSRPLRISEAVGNYRARGKP